MLIVTVFGMGCSRCRDLESMVSSASMQAGIDVQIEVEDDLDTMIFHRVKSTPCLLIDGQIYFDDHHPERSEVEFLLKSLSS